MRDLYPEISPFNHFNLEVSEKHTIYVEEVGNPNGAPVIFLHGGPGSGCNEGQKAIFVKGGQALDIFEPGTFTLPTGN